MREGSYALQLLVLVLQVLRQADDVFLLLAYELLMLKLEKFLLLFEVVHDLLQGLLKHNNLFLEEADLPLLRDTTLLVLLCRVLLNNEIALHL